MNKVLGLIVELNPFHNGHKYFIDEAIKHVKPEVVIALTSGNYTMRGEISIVDKFTKTKQLLNLNVDLVLELPFLSAMNSADFFALNSLNILSKFKITDLAFGVELANLDKLNQMKAIIDSDLFNEKIKEKLALGLSYSASSYKVISELTKDKELIENFTLPNNTLGIQYLRSIEKLKKKINVTLIKRIENNYYDEIALSEIASATSLRLLLEKNEDIEKYVPDFGFKINYQNPKEIEEKLLFLLRSQFINLTLSDIQKIFGVNEGIENRINNFLNKVNSYQELINNVKTKRYPQNKIKRLLLHIIMNTSNKYLDKSNYYFRVLGASDKGLNYINKLPKTTKAKIITSFKNMENNDLVLQELKATKLYGLITNQPNLYLEEFKVPIIGGKK